MESSICFSLPSECAGLVENSIDIGDGQQLLCINFSAKDKFISSLTESGWSEVRRFNVGGTCGCFFEKGNETLYFYENARVSTAKAVYGATLPVCFEKGEQLYDDTLMYMFETRWEHEPYPGGMTYLIRLRDGRFIIVDGGFEVKADELVAMMRRLHPHAEEGKIFDVAAWIFTHPHDDHIELIKRLFADEASFKKIKIHSVISNSPSPEFMAERCASSALDAAKLREFTERLCETSTAFFKPHTGMTFNIGELEFKIFFTQNEWAAADMVFLNDSSTVFSVSREGGRSIMMLGDIMEFAGVPIMEMYTAHELHADAVQVAHHAVRGPEIEIYEAICPKLCFWNMQPKCYELYSTQFKRNVKLRELDAFHIISCFGPAQVTI